MNELLYQKEFDFTVGSVRLVHKNTFVKGFKWVGYRGGRMTDGLVYCLSGRANFDFGVQRLELREGQMLFLPACVSYTVQGVDETPFVHFTANFTCSAESECLPEPIAALFTGRACFATDSDPNEQNKEAFAQMVSVWQAKKFGYQPEVRGILYRLLQRYFAEVNRAVHRSDAYDRIRPAKKYLDTHFAETASVAELAALCGLSETHFRRQFVGLLGVSPVEYRLQKQIMRAKDLLLSEQYTVKEVASLVGFSSAHYFSRVFHAKVGRSPGEFTREE